MKGKDGFVQAYNGQLAVDARAQVIVACDLTDEAVDAGRLVPLLDRIEHNLGRRAKEISADVGYCSEANLQALDDRGIRGYLATGRQKHPAAGEDQRRGPLVRAMRRKLKRGGRRSRYRLRKQTVEPVFGQIKQARRFRQFLLRGLAKVQAEWTLICTAHNTLKLIKALPA
jgi:Transposase DDE domain